MLEVIRNMDKGCEDFRYKFLHWRGLIGIIRNRISSYFVYSSRNNSKMKKELEKRFQVHWNARTKEEMHLKMNFNDDVICSLHELNYIYNSI
mmetsp:Transcript_1340/g.1928  ORF Transcript_1340/g.1928 Transcript_1340/m.1928 type:complete len:92 (+) Transcript_1340:361-636(+)